MNPQFSDKDEALRHLESEQKRLTAELDTALASCAGMREALEFVKKHAVFGLGYLQIKPWEIVYTALSSDSGADILARLKAAEADSARLDWVLKNTPNVCSRLMIDRFLDARAKEGM